MTTFAAVGLTCIDVYKNLDYCYPTGNGIDLMFNLMDMVPTLEPSVVTAIGDDANGELLLAACRRRNVSIDHVTIVPGGVTAVFEMLLNGRDRVHYRGEKGVMLSYCPSGADMDFIRTRDFIHTDLSWPVTDLLADMRRDGTRIYFDFSKKYGHPDMERCLKNIDYGIFSFEQETEEVRQLLKHGCGLGASVLIATFGEKGSLAYDGQNFYRQACIPAQNLMNTVGAGDSFGAGFMSGILRKLPVAECMRLGAEKSSEIVSMFEPYPMKNDEDSFERRQNG